MKALILQNSTATPPGTTIDWLVQKNISYDIHFFSSGKMISAQDYDLFFICGGGMNVDQEEIYPWLTEEKKFITELISQNKKIVGLCLGAQLLAELLGGKVFKAPHWEAGWQDVSLSNGKTLRVFEWHGYQFISPPGSTVVAFNKACAHQAFTYGKNIIAFQFHPESTREWIIERAEDVDAPPAGQYVQNKEMMLAELDQQKQLQQWYFSELNNFL